MNNFILLLTNRADTVCFDNLAEYLTKNEIGNYTIIQENSIEDAYEHLFKTELCLIIGDITLEGGKEALQMIKNEEMSKHIPIVVLIEENNIEITKRAYESGADAVVSNEMIDIGLLPYIARPLIMNNILLNKNINKLSGLQDKAINDFILLDLVKAYIPKTIWEIALDCAHRQKMYIPEEETEKTIVFGDIIGFTKMTQHMDPKNVIETLNEAYDIVTEIIYKYEGDIDKFVGDAFIGIFDSALDAVKSSIEIQIRISELNDKRAKENLCPILFRIGINTGSVIRGNVGGHQRYDNTLIGDAVNTASRLEHIAPVGDIVISEATRLKAELDIPEELRNSITLRGKDSEDIYYTVFNYLKGRI
ncbi:MAG: adenylate/guanylate cyclase domain-containing protein [Spirochaetales bacterium]|nr:adenylate/guanylate cyclase domain-containing protein [Spirochaetales bacterium]